jgi:GrpB-like predicted nucleotidyltransferase (UPF0157 family)
MRILPYFEGPAEFRPYDPAVAEMARTLGEAVREIEARLQVEHVGSTSVPGCGGKGIVDLAVLYPQGLLATARSVLDGLGFQKQGGPEPFPEERPMRVGGIAHAGRSYRIHAHVVELDGDEHHAMVWFRDRLRGDAALRQRYEARKQSILAMGINDALEYCKAKGDFVTEVLKLAPSASSGAGSLDREKQ